jgi:hypothetical protein
VSDSVHTTRMPTFNHVAMSVPAELLDEQGRRDLLRFYGEVFGWTEMPTLTEDRERLVLRAYNNEQFVFLVADSEPMHCPAGDHFGMSVGTPRELLEMLERARKFRERDDRVEIVEHEMEDYGVLKLHNCYVRYRLPMMVEVQCYEWARGFDGDSLPES